MRILYVTSAELARAYAPASRAKGLAAALARRGHSVHLLGTAPGAGFSLPRGTVRLLRHPQVRRVGALVWHFDLARQLLGSGRFDALLLRETPLTVEPALYARLRRLPLVLEVNGIAPDGLREGLSRACYRWNYDTASRIVVLTEALGRHLTDNFGVSPDRLRVIPNAADVDRFSPRPGARARLGLPDSAFVVVYMGSYHEQQGADAVIPLCRSVRDRIPEILFLMTGEGEALRARVGEAGLGAHFRFTGSVPDDRIADCVSAADVAFSPIRPAEAWRTEATFPQKIVEYLSCGTPVLAMGHSEAQRRILEGCGRLVPADDAGGLAGTLVDWRRDPDLRRRMGEAGRAKVRERFSYDAVAARFEDLFRSL